MLRIDETELLSMRMICETIVVSLVGFLAGLLQVEEVEVLGQVARLLLSGRFLREFVWELLVYEG